jgi:hypothetical protein
MLNLAKHEEMKMRNHGVGKIVKMIILAAIALGLFGLLVMALWNWLMPAIFGLTAITYWQAFGLLILSWILLGGFRGPGYRHHRWRRRMAERWARMSPEEREKFREDMRHHWRHHHGK